MIQLKTSTDWPVVKDQIKNLAQTLPAFRHDFERIIVNLEKQVKKLSNLEVEVRRTRNKNSQNRCQSCVDQINRDLQHMQQWYLISIMSD
jgi:hypothetical protein